MAIAFCPDCDGSVNVGASPRLGQRINCPHCDAELEVIEVSPLELDWAYDEPETDWGEEEEWDDDEDDEDDEDDWDDDWDDDEDEDY
jgi:alpha-aminoadipate carrier protein LysW